MRFIRQLAKNGYALVAFAIVVHLALVIIGSTVAKEATGDVLNSYKPWVDALHVRGKWGGINTEWVYPFLAWAPILLAKVMVFVDYQSAWLIMACALSIFALGQLVSWGRRRQNFKAVWYYLAFIGLLGPVAITRLDGISVSLALIGVASLQIIGNTDGRGDRLTLRTDRALIWLTIAAWIKVWAIALILGLLQLGKNFRRQILVVAITGASVLALAGLLGANGNLFSFIWFQSNRGLQIESPIANTWVWLAALKVPGSIIYFDTELMTFQVSGPLDSVFSALMGYAMLVAIAITALLIWQGNRAGVPAARLASLGGLTATVDLIVFNKVGSPQYQLWIVVPVVMGLYFGLTNWRVPVIATLLLAALTQVVYPIMYTSLVEADPLAVSFLTARNLVLIALLVWSNIELGKRPSQALTV